MKMILWLFVAASIVSAAWGDCSVGVNQECTLSFQDANLTEIEARLRIVENMKFSDPPTWAEGKDHGNLGSYTAGSPISVYVEAKDSEGGEVTYKKISGSFPAGVTLDAKTGKISGVAPYIDASFSFGIRASNEHGRCADAVFTMDIRGLTLCSDDDDCLNGGNCTVEDDGAYNQVCKCAVPFGGDRCEVDCSANAVGVADRDIIKDAQFTAYYMYSSHYPWYGRLNYGNYWRASSSSSSWLQVSFNKLYEVYAIETQGYSSSYGVTSFRLASSVDGNTFTYYTESSSSYKTFSMSSGSKITRNELKVPTRMSAIRFYVMGYHNSNGALRVEVYGCPVIDVE